MSDYVRKKAIVYPIPNDIADKLDKLFNDEFKDIYSWSSDENRIGFDIEAFDTEELRYYLIYQLFYSYGEDSGDFGSNRVLTDEESIYWTNKFKPVLARVGIDITPSKLKYLDWCYYDSCESLDYYIIDAEDTIKMDKRVAPQLPITDEEKAKELVCKNCPIHTSGSTVCLGCDRFFNLIKMSNWKKDQMVLESCSWFYIMSSNGYIKDPESFIKLYKQKMGIEDAD